MLYLCIAAERIQILLLSLPGNRDIPLRHPRHMFCIDPKHLHPQLIPVFIRQRRRALPISWLVRWAYQIRYADAARRHQHMGRIEIAIHFSGSGVEFSIGSRATGSLSEEGRISRAAPDNKRSGTILFLLMHPKGTGCWNPASRKIARVPQTLVLAGCHGAALKRLLHQGHDPFIGALARKICASRNQGMIAAAQPLHDYGDCDPGIDGDRTDLRPASYARAQQNKDSRDRSSPASHRG